MFSTGRRPEPAISSAYANPQRCSFPNCAKATHSASPDVRNIRSMCLSAALCAHPAARSHSRGLHCGCQVLLPFTPRRSWAGSAVAGDCRVPGKLLHETFAVHICLRAVFSLTVGHSPAETEGTGVVVATSSAWWESHTNISVAHTAHPAVSSGAGQAPIAWAELSPAASGHSPAAGFTFAFIGVCPQGRLPGWLSLNTQGALPESLQGQCLDAFPAWHCALSASEGAPATTPHPNADPSGW